MAETIRDISRRYFEEWVKPVLEREFPDTLARSAFGFFGIGSEVLGYDDKYSRDHHWGVRIDALMPDDLLEAQGETMQRALAAPLADFRKANPLLEDEQGGQGFSPNGFKSFLERSIGIDHPPETLEEWLLIPEEDIIHIVNGEVWHDPAGRFTEIRKSFANHYPEPVRRRRMAHLCRKCSGMGTYALMRARLRDDEYFALVATARSVRWGVQLGFLLDRVYYPYDKWLMAAFKQLPRMYERLHPIVDEAARLSSSWDRKQELVDEMSDVIDQAMVEDGLIQPHPKYAKSPTSGYRLLEHAYLELLQGLPSEIVPVVPQMEQVFLEKSGSSGLVMLSAEAWLAMLNLEPE